MSKRFVFLALAMAVFSLSAAAGDAAATSTLPNPLKNAKAGQWVHYRMNTLFGTADQKQTLVGIEGEGDDRVLSIKSEMTIDDEIVDERTDAITYRAAMDEQERALSEAENVQITTTTADFKGAKMNAVQMDFVQEGKRCVLILSEDVPLIGMIRMEVEGQEEPAMELLDFGE